MQGSNVLKSQIHFLHPFRAISYAIIVSNIFLCSFQWNSYSTTGCWNLHGVSVWAYTGYFATGLYCLICHQWFIIHFSLKSCFFLNWNYFTCRICTVTIKIFYFEYRRLKVVLKSSSRPQLWLVELKWNLQLWWVKRHIVTARVRSTREGNVLTRVCPSINLSVHRGGTHIP